MEWMDGARRFGGLAWVAAGVVFGLGWTVAGTVPGPITSVLALAVIVLAVLVITGRAGWLWGRVVAVLLAADFAGAVADRFGAFGAPGASGVSWGRWSVFVDYTRTLLHGVPEPVAVAAAVGGTAAEVGLAALLVTGWQRRWVGKATAGLLTAYLVAMAASVGWADVARYALPLLIGGALLVTVTPDRRHEVAAVSDVDARGARPGGAGSDVDTPRPHIAAEQVQL
jgi:hypothetical protein